MESFNALQQTSQTLSMQVVSCEEARSRAEADLRIEREWRSALQSKESEFRETISKQQLRINQIMEENKVR